MHCWILLALQETAPASNDEGLIHYLKARITRSSGTRAGGCAHRVVLQAKSSTPSSLHYLDAGRLRPLNKMLTTVSHVSDHSLSYHANNRRCCRRWHAAASTRCSAVSRRELLGTAPLLLATQPALASEVPPATPDDGFLDILPLPGTPAASAANKKKFRRPPPKVSQVKLAPGLKVSKIIKGCWQLDGQHKGDAKSDRTSGAAALEDFDTFAAAGACHSTCVAVILTAPQGMLASCVDTHTLHCLYRVPLAMASHSSLSAIMLPRTQGSSHATQSPVLCTPALHKS